MQTSRRQDRTRAASPPRLSRDRPLYRGGSPALPLGYPWGEGGDVDSILVWCWRVSAWCGVVGVVEGYCRLLLQCIDRRLERFLEGRRTR